VLVEEPAVPDPDEDAAVLDPPPSVPLEPLPEDVLVVLALPDPPAEPLSLELPEPRESVR
jgi:hypothetical protein